MTGNVNEWVADFYHEKAYISLADGQANPTGPAMTDDHVIRGGSFGLNASKLRRQLSLAYGDLLVVPGHIMQLPAEGRVFGI